MTLLNGAEAVVRKEGDTLVKERVPKAYRHPTLDKELRKSRSRREKKLLIKAGQYVRVPKIMHGDDDTLVMEFIDGPMVKEVLDTVVVLARSIGESLGALHKHDIIHGDLTTSNMLFFDDKVVFIDFGLGFTSKKDEDKAVDVHVFKQSLESRHHLIKDEAYKLFLEGYRVTNDGAESVLERLVAVEKRGRNKAKDGS